MAALYTHHLSDTISSPNVVTRALDVLSKSLPVSLPTYRRLQFGRFLDDTSFLVTNLDLSSPTPDLAGEPYLIAFVDRSTRPETEVWLHASWDSLPSIGGKRPFPHTDELALLLAFLRTCAALPVPQSIHADFLEEQSSADYDAVGAAGLDHLGFSKHDYAGHSANPRIMLWGAVHEETTSRLDQLGVLSSEWQSAKVPNYTFVFRVADLPQPKPLPTGFRWGEVQAKHFALVKSRTQIARQDKTMAVLPSVALYEDGRDDPVAWAFVGIDGSETTLHVESEYRKRGLAKAVATKLFTEKMERFFLDDRARQLEEMAHAHVINGNEQSVGVCKSLRGQSDWYVYWLRVDLDRVVNASI